MLGLVNVKGDFCYIKQVQGSVVNDIKGSYYMTSNLLKKTRKGYTEDLYVSPRAALCQDASTTESSSVITQEQEH